MSRGCTNRTWWVVKSKTMTTKATAMPQQKLGIAVCHDFAEKCKPPLACPRSFILITSQSKQYTNIRDLTSIRAKIQMLSLGRPSLSPRLLCHVRLQEDPPLHAPDHTENSSSTKSKLESDVDC